MVNANGAENMTKMYVLTGGSGSGKSSILLHLEMMGEYVLREAAEDYIRLRQAQGQKQPWTEEDFQDKILDLQLLRKKRIPEDIERVWSDREVPDGMAYAKPGTKTYERLKEESQKQSYEKIFLIEPLAIMDTNGVRRENLDEAIMLGNKLEAIYKEIGCEPIRIPAGPLEQRVKAILDEII